MAYEIGLQVHRQSNLIKILIYPQMKLVFFFFCDPKFNSTTLEIAKCLPSSIGFVNTNELLKHAKMVYAITSHLCSIASLTCTIFSLCANLLDDIFPQVTSFKLYPVFKKYVLPFILWIAMSTLRAERQNNVKMLKEH